MIQVAVFCLSLSTLALEILLSRVFSITQWNHLAFMVISIAMFGFAAGGTLLSLLESRRDGWLAGHLNDSQIVCALSIYSASALTASLLCVKLPLDYIRLGFEARQIFYLFCAYLGLTPPFFLAGLILSAAFARHPQKSGRIYAASMAGSACGALLPIPLIPVLGESRLLPVVSLIPLCASLWALLRPGAKHPDPGVTVTSRLSSLAGWVVLLGVGGFLASAQGTAWLKIDPSPYKSLSQLLLMPQSQLKESRSSIQGRIDRVTSDFIRFAPGRSLKDTRLLPSQQALFRDADHRLVLYDTQSRDESAFVGWTLPFLGYTLVRHPASVLIIQNGGGTGILAAMASAAPAIAIVEPNPHLAEAIAQNYHLPVKNSAPRSFLAQSSGRFSVIQIDDWGNSLIGAAALSQDHNFTREAFDQYFQHLNDDGVLILSRHLLLPPSDAIRLWATAYETLQRQAIARPEDHLLMLRNWDAFTLVMTRRSLSTLELLNIRTWAKERNFDLVAAPGLEEAEVNRFNRFATPFHYQALQQLSAAYRSGTESVFFQDYLLDVAPQSDRRPFPGRFFKWSHIRTIFRQTGERWHALLLSGEVVVWLLLAESALIAVFLLLWPVRRAKKGLSGVPGTTIVYFLATGAGFMAAEMFFIKRLTLILGDPLISVAVSLAGVLSFSSMGGFWSQHLGPRGLYASLASLLAVLIGIFLFQDILLQAALEARPAGRYALAGLFLMPLSIAMGLPFPAAMRLFLDHPVQHAYAWSANGCTSVLTAIAAEGLAISQGTDSLLTAAFGMYLVALYCAGRHRSIRFRKSDP
jgi:hypothetical protein